VGAEVIRIFKRRMAALVMIDKFSRRQPIPAQPTTTQSDILTAHAWQLTLTQWHSLTDFERAECRRNVTTAPRFGEGK
jgi:hypothetical protein